MSSTMLTVVAILMPQVGYSQVVKGEVMVARPVRWQASIDSGMNTYWAGSVSTRIAPAPSIALANDGRVITANSRSAELRVLSPNGRPLFAIEQSEKGIMSRRAPCCMSIAPNGELWVADNNNRQYSVFRLDAHSATLLRTVNLPARARAYAVSWTPEGQPHLMVDIFDEDGDARRVRLIMGKDGSTFAGDTLHNPIPLAERVLHIQQGNGSTGIAAPFGPVFVTASAANGETVSAVSTRYDITWRARDGQVLRRLMRDLAGPSVSASERDRAEDDLAALARRLGIPRLAIPFHTPVEKPPILALAFDREGRLWVERSVTEGQSRTADVYDRLGLWIAEATWPTMVDVSYAAVAGMTAFGYARSSGSNRIVRMSFAVVGASR